MKWPKLLLFQFIVALAVVLAWHIFFTEERNPWQRIYNKSDKSVVEIYALALKETNVGLQSGTGFIVKTNGRLAILTNRHVVSPANSAMVKFYDDIKTVADLLDASELHDLAILVPREINLNRYEVLPAGNSSDLKIGEELMTIGNPLSEIHHISVGFYTGKFTDNRGRTLLRLAMAIDPGNSGGPLLNRKGKVVGILTQKDPKSANIAFAIPIEKLRNLAVANENS